MSKGKVRILIAIDWYLPGYKAGGPVRSVANLVDALSGRFDFSILTSDTEYRETEPYADVEPDEWVRRSPHCRVWYASRDHRSYRHFRGILSKTGYDILYLNSLFSIKYTLFPLWISRSSKPEIPIVLAPRGMVHPSALSLKSRKKKLYLTFFKWMGLHKKIIWQATDDTEAEHLRDVFGEGIRILKAPALPRLDLPPFEPPEKEIAQLNMAFIGRICEKKGVHTVLESLRGQSARIHFDVFGPDKEPGYWDRCTALIAELPENITVKKHAPVPPDEIPGILRAHHCLVLGTTGENFGHAILESLSAGRPVIISEQTPWRGLEAKKAGFDLPLAPDAPFRGAIARLAALDREGFEKWCRGAYAFAEDFVRNAGGKEKNVRMFERALELAKEELGEG